MRSLGTIRARVERLASVYPSAEEPPLIIHWKMPVERCPSCGTAIDAEEEAVARAEAEAEADRARGEARRIYWAELTTCPRCGARLP